MYDQNLRYVIKISDVHLGLNLSENLENVEGLNFVKEFLDNKNALILFAHKVKEKDCDGIEFVNQLSSQNVHKFVVFYKNKPSILSDENAFSTNVHIIAMNGPVSHALYHSLNNVYLPLLNKEELKNPSINRQVASLQADLRSAILASDQRPEGGEEVNYYSLAVITSLEHEAAFWNESSKISKGKDDLLKSASFREMLKPLAEEFCVIDALQLNEIENLLENAHNVLDDLWRHTPPYPKERMPHLMEIIGSDVARSLTKRLKTLNVWSEDFNVISDVLLQSLTVSEHWTTTCKELTEIFWPNYSLHTWNKPPFVPRDLVDLNTRLHEVLNIRTIHKQLVRLLTSNEQDDLDVDGMFKPFKELDLVNCDPHTEPHWMTAKKQFEHLLRPAEQRVASKLKKQFSGMNTNVRQLLHEFGRYSELIGRPVMKEILLTERQYLLSSLQDYVQNLESPESSQVYTGNRDSSPIVIDIMTTRQIENRVAEVLKISDKILSDLDGYEEFKQRVSELSKEVKQQHSELFNAWTSEMTAKIRDKSLCLQESDPVVKFSSNKLMIVNYSPRLVTLNNEVRQLSAMGYRIPSNIEQTSTHARQFIKFARILEQIANFHNTIGDRMHPSQRPMMLASAVNLSRLVQEQEVVSWGNLKSVEKYVENLKIAVEQLSKDNTYLTACHNQILDKINRLEDIDLIKEYDKWRDLTKAMRDVVNQIQQKGFKSMQSWKFFLDKAICKVLEKQYIKSLDKLHLYLPEIYTELVYRNAQLQFSPPEDVLKEKYQQQLKRFIDIPKNFRGVSETTEGKIFEEIIERNDFELIKVTKHMEELFEQLRGVLKHWEAWLPKENLDISQLKTWQNWDLHFRASKTFGQEIAKLPSTEEKIGCFLVGLSRLRSDLESHNRSSWDQLVSTLKDSIAEDVVRLQDYVDPSTATLTKHPVTLEQIGEADASHANILKQALEMGSLYKDMHQKTKILSIWSREKVDSVNRLAGAWERLQSLLENHQHIIAKQIETAKTTLNINNENLVEEIERFAAKWEQVKPRPGSGHIVNDNLKQLHQHLQNIKEKRDQWNEIQEHKEKLMLDYEKFGLDKPEFSSDEKVAADLEREEKAWDVFKDFYDDFEKLGSEEWIVFRKKTYRLEDFLSSWRDKLEKTENSALITRMLQEIHKYEDLPPVLKYVRGEDFTDRHWMEVFSLMEMPPKSVNDLIFIDFLDASEKLIANAEKLKFLSKKAASEVVVRQALSELDQWEVEARFVLTPHADSSAKEVYLVKGYRELLGRIGDNQSLLQSVKNSADYESFSERAELWETRLADLDKHLTSMAHIQRKWVYLEPIFSTGTLEQEKNRFLRLDKEFRHILSFIEKDSRVSALLRYPSLRSVLENLQTQLSRCQQSLDDFLSEKRAKFPRFLFLGDDDLLEVVGQSSKEKVIQTHLKKLFAGINSIILAANGKAIVAICSLQGEIVPLKNAVGIERPVEEWLNVLVAEMQSSLQNLLVLCIDEGSRADPLKYPSQILCLAESVAFTSKCERAIETMTLPPLLANYKTQLNHYSSYEMNEGTDKSLTSFGSLETDESSLLELKLKALLLDTIHYINVLEHITKANVTSINDWEWQRQLRFYSDHSGRITVKMANAVLEYSYEYLGNAQKLVRTPLTDRCFLTLTQGMHLGMGGNPYGPAGTGKTESVKALGALLGRQVLVFNCDEGIDAASMGRILSGLVRSGAWGCFDEFNRLDEATLSAISMYIQPIQTALKTGQNTVALLGQEMILDKHCGIFVTLNPAGGGYGGRNRLPDNLKQLFRPVIMTHPDHFEIARTLLHCDSYKNADAIGSKLVEVLDLAGKLLSKKQHYDWGLRTLRTVLGSCSRALKIHIKSVPIQDSEIYKTEMNLVLNALRVDTLSKLTFTDSAKFDEILKDVFRESIFDVASNESFVKHLENSCREMGLVVNERQISKCMQLYEQLKQRMGVALVGPPGSGKSTVRNILLQALIKSGKHLKQHTLNPKSMPRSQLLGQVDANTRQWNDGVLTLYSLQVTSEPSEVWSWIVCDGDIDPEWVESLNSVLDDNRLLSLPSGWRIQFGPNVNFIFETHSLRYASPATISRMGIVFLSEEDLDLNDYVTNFINKFPESIRIRLEPLVADYFLKGVNWLTAEGDVTVARSKLAITNSGLSHLVDVNSKAQFTVALLNGLGGQLNTDVKETFAQQIFEWTGELTPSKLTLARYNKDRDLVDCYCTSRDTREDNTCSRLPLVPTGSVQQTLDCLRTWLIQGKEQHFLLVGQHGSAKRLILEFLVKERYDIEMATIHCSAHVTPQYVIHKFSQHCIVVNTNKGRVYKPKKPQLLLHFKNIHLLKPDEWGTNMLITFLQQLITYKGFFDSSLEWVGIENVTIVGTLTPKNNLPPRFASSLHVYNISLPDQEDLSVIFHTYISSIIKRFAFPNSAFPKTKITNMTNSLISIYLEVRNSFSEMENYHYSFSPHDLTHWCEGILRYQVETDCNAEKWLLEIVYYEAMRIFGDKLINELDRIKFSSIMSNQLQKHWGYSIPSGAIGNSFYVPIQETTNSKKAQPLVKLSKSDWSNYVKRGVTQYEREGQNLDLQLTDELLYLTSSAAKALSVHGNLLMVGRSGIGRRSSIKILSALNSCKLIIPNNSSQFNSDLKNAMQAIISDEEVYLLLQDHILMAENIRNVVNTLLSSGEVPGLYTVPETDSLLAGLKEEASSENFDGDLSQFFIERVKCRLHVITCLDVDNNNLLEIFEQCPALLQNSTIIWLTEWSKATMENFPQMMMTQKNENVVISANFHEVYDVVKEKLGAPSRYVAMISLYAQLYLTKKEAIENERKKLQAGVSKLTEAREVVDELKKDASVQQEKLAEKQMKANAALEMISNTMKNANVQKEEMQVLKGRTEKENQQLIKRKKEIELELAEVEPLIQEARAAVGNIKPESLSEIRSLRAPPDVIRDILEGVLRLMGIQDTSWNSMKTFLSKRGVKEDIRSFDASRIYTDNRQMVEKLMSNKSDSFDPKAAKRASVVAAPLAAWVIANVKYSKIADKIRPLEREQNRLKQNLQNAEAQLEELSTGLLDVDATVAKLKEQLSTYTKEAAEIEIGLKKAQNTLSSAEGLVQKLNDEYGRWKDQLEILSQELEMLPFNCLLSSAFVTYLAGESEDERLKILNKWIEILSPKKNLSKFVLREFLSSEREQLQWQSEGLSADQLSIQNGIIILKTNLYPLILDPSSLALSWLKKHLKHKKIETVTQDSEKFKTQLDLAVRFGKVLMVEGVENISPSLFSILRNEFVFQGERKLVNINGRLVDYHNDFQLILSSRNAKLQLSSELTSLLNTINFTITHAGLTEQLLTNAIRQESPKLEERRKQLLKEQEEMQEKLHDFQNRLLDDLASSVGNLLENTSLLNSLNETKASSTAITKALKESSEVQKSLQEESAAFEKISVFGSFLYFGAIEFSKVNSFYSLSVRAYTRLFLKAVSSFEETEVTYEAQQRLLVQSLYRFMARGIFKSDRLNFALHLVHKVFPQQIMEREWEFFLGNTVAVSKQDLEVDDLPGWIPEQNKQAFMGFQLKLGELFENLKLGEYSLWKHFMENDACENYFPTHCKLTDFQKLLVVQLLRPDRLYSAMQSCVVRLTGLTNLNPDVVSLSHILKEFINTEPILLLTTSGNDPSLEIRKIAEVEIGTDKYREVAMGEGQEKKALLALEEATRTGQWLALKNLHLVVSWLPLLCQYMQSTDFDKKFRLWLITEHHPMFSPVLIQQSLKIVYEAPQGIKHNLLRSYAMWGDNYIKQLSANSARIFFVCACIHALLQERRTYIPQGWLNYYEFSDVDMTTAVKLAEALWTKQNVQWKYLIGLFYNAVYGGRIEDMQDLKVLKAYLNQYFVEDVLSHRWRSFGLQNSLPNAASYQEYVNAILQLPNSNLPSHFGLPPNINRAWERNCSVAVISQLKDLDLTKNITKQFNLKIWQKQLTPFISLWKKLNQGHDFIKLNVPEVSTDSSPISAFISEEYRTGVTLIHSIHKCFATINKIIRGQLLPDKNHIEESNSLMSHQTPKNWLNIWQGPKDPSKYLRNVLNKTVHLANSRNSTDFLNSPVNLTQFFHPEAFLASYKQENSRKSGVPMDQLVLRTSWKSTSNNEITIRGLLIEGGLFDGNVLMSCKANSENINVAPDCFLSWIKEDKILRNEKFLDVPVYYTPTREKHLTVLQVPCSTKEADSWILSGLAFLLDY